MLVVRTTEKFIVCSGRIKCESVDRWLVHGTLTVPEHKAAATNPYKHNVFGAKLISTDWSIRTSATLVVVNTFRYELHVIPLFVTGNKIT